MSAVWIRDAAVSRPRNRWADSLAQIGLDVVADLERIGEIDALYVAAPTAGRLGGADCFAACLADRLAWPRRLEVHGVDGGEVAGAAALQRAFRDLRGGFVRRALVVGVAFVAAV